MGNVPENQQKMVAQFPNIGDVVHWVQKKSASNGQISIKMHSKRHRCVCANSHAVHLISWIRISNSEKHLRELSLRVVGMLVKTKYHVWNVPTHIHTYGRSSGTSLLFGVKIDSGVRPCQKRQSRKQPEDCFLCVSPASTVCRPCWSVHWAGLQPFSSGWRRC